MRIPYVIDNYSHRLGTADWVADQALYDLYALSDSEINIAEGDG